MVAVGAGALGTLLQPLTTGRAAEQAVTYNQQIAPILNSNCVGCHHPGGPGPFSLTTLDDARRWSEQILSATQTRYMPPWLPEPGFGEFQDVHRLSDENIAAIKSWIDSGMAAGNGQAPRLPPDAGEWALGKPDLVLNAEASGPDANGTPRWVAHIPAGRARAVRAMQISFGGAQSVQEARVEIAGPQAQTAFWTPNSAVIVEPASAPLLLPRTGDLVINARTSGAESGEVAKPRIGLYFAARPGAGQARWLELNADHGINIPAGKQDFVVEDQLRLPGPVTVFAIYPQAHLLGKDVQAYATLPGGAKRWLLWIRHWDVERVAVYRYTRPVALPRGAVVHLRYTYDNSAGNPHNPNDPPKPVSAGEGSANEVAHLWLQVMGPGAHSALGR